MFAIYEKCVCIHFSFISYKFVNKLDLVKHRLHVWLKIHNNLPNDVLSFFFAKVANVKFTL